MSSAALGRWRCDSVQTHARRRSIVLLKQTATRPTGLFAELRKTQSDTPQPSDHHEIYLGASGGYVDLEHTVRQPPTEAAWRGGDLTDSSLSQPHITHKALQGKILRGGKKSDAMCVCLFCFTRGHRGTGRSIAAPRGTAVAAATHTKLPATVLTREVQAPRARGAAGSAGYRPPLLAVTHESYDDYVSPIPFCTCWKVWLIIISHELCVNQTWFDPPLHVIRMDVASHGEAGHSGTHVWEIRASRKSLRKSLYLINFNS